LNSSLASNFARACAVERAGVGEVDGELCVDAAEVDHVLDEHAEGRAPVADVVLADDGVADELQHAHQRVADDRGAQVADVHLLGHVRRRVVHHRDLGTGGRAHADPLGSNGRLDELVGRGTPGVKVRLMKPGPATSA
jgi:hypothetical protein